MTLQTSYYERAKAGCWWLYTFGKDRMNIFNPILPTCPNYSFTFPCYTYITVPPYIYSGPLTGYTRVVEWVLGRPAEL